MTDIIYKYGPIEHTGTEIKGEPIHVGLQNGDIFVWCRLLHMNNSDTNRIGKVAIVATGEPYYGRYIGTVIMPSALVWHIVEV